MCPNKKLTPISLSFSVDDFITYQGNQVFSPSFPEPNELCWHCPDELGCGTFKRIKIRPGFDLWLSDCSFYRDIHFNDYNVPATIQFSFTLSCNYYVRFNGCKDIQQFYGEYQAIGFHNAPCSYCKIMHNIPMRYVSLTLTRDAFISCFEEYMKNMPALIHRVMKMDTGSGFLYKSAITPSIREVMQQIIDYPHNGLTRKIFMESKALELLSLLLHQISDCPPKCDGCPLMHPHDKKQIQGVRDLLINNLDTPPSLKELARSAGMSHPKLNRCFKQVYGMTVFQYLRLERLNKAKNMLQKDGYSVTETALEVGYDSVSHFSQAYKRQFGTSPSSSLKVA